jgi:hypothetical protein
MARLLGWIVAGLASAVGLGWLATQVATTWSPLILFPLLLGVMLGVLLVVFMRMSQVHNGWLVYTVAILAVVLTILTQHWFLYLEAKQDMDQNLDMVRQMARQFPDEFHGNLPQPPANFWEYLQHDARQPRTIVVWNKEATFQGTRTWLLWGLNLAITLLTALLILHQGRNRPWCATCRSWYRTTRRGHLDRATTERLLAALQKFDSEESETDSTPTKTKTPANDRYASFLICDCDGRCGRTELRILQIANSEVTNYYLPPDQRREIEAILDTR